MPVEAAIFPHIAEEMAHLFTAADVDVPEDEVWELVEALTRAAKPVRVLAMAPYKIKFRFAQHSIDEPFAGVPEYGGPYDFVFMDQLPLPQRADDLAALIERDLLTPRAVVAIHDTSRCRTLKDGTLDPEAAEFWARMERNVIRRFKPRAVLELPLSRGLTLIQV